MIGKLNLKKTMLLYDMLVLIILIILYYGSWSEIKSFLKKISKPIKISLSLWENKLDDIYKEVLSSEFFEAIDDHKSFYFRLSDASINILDLI